MKGPNVNTAPGALTSETELSLSLLLRRVVVDAKEKSLARLEDVIVKLRDDQYPLLWGLVIRIGTSRIFVPMSDVTSIEATSIRLPGARLDLRPFTRRDGEVLLKEDVLGHRLIDIAHSALVKAYDIRLKATPEGWAATGLDVHKHEKLVPLRRPRAPSRPGLARLPAAAGQS